MFKHTLLSLFIFSTLGTSVVYADSFNVLKQISNKPVHLKDGEYKGNYYVPSTLNTITWGYLPNKDAKPVISVPSGSVITFDTEPYRVCRRPLFLRECPDEKSKIHP